MDQHVPRPIDDDAPSPADDIDPDRADAISQVCRGVTASIRPALDAINTQLSAIARDLSEAKLRDELALAKARVAALEAAAPKAAETKAPDDAANPAGEAAKGGEGAPVEKPKSTRRKTWL